ncbi:MAG: hypothetical protein R2911_05300 [Caldilineaceae bacterium]
MVHQARRPEMLEEFNIPLDECIRRCEVQITEWRYMKQKMENPTIDIKDEYAKAMKEAGVPEQALPRGGAL